MKLKELKSIDNYELMQREAYKRLQKLINKIDDGQLKKSLSKGLKTKWSSYNGYLSFKTDASYFVDSPIKGERFNMKTSVEMQYDAYTKELTVEFENSLQAGFYFNIVIN